MKKAKARLMGYEGLVERLTQERHRQILKTKRQSIEIKVYAFEKKRVFMSRHK